jgi:hypothetical protein
VEDVAEPEDLEAENIKEVIPIQRIEEPEDIIEKFIKL